MIVDLAIREKHREKSQGSATGRYLGMCKRLSQLGEQGRAPPGTCVCPAGAEPETGTALMISVGHV